MKKHDSFIKPSLLITMLAVVVMGVRAFSGPTLVWVVVGPPSQQPLADSIFTTTLGVSAWNGVPGAIELTLNHDPGLLEMLDVTFPDDTPFASNCVADLTSTGSGQTRIGCFQTTDTEPSEALTNFAVVTWQVAEDAGTETDITIDVTNLFETQWSAVELFAFGLHLNISMGFAMPLLEGWNLVALPAQVPDAHFLMLFSSAEDRTLFGFNGTYFEPDPSVLELGKGYWLRFPEAEATTVIGTAVMTHTVALLEGWNLVAGISCSVPLSSLSDPGDIIIDGTLWGFDGSYFEADTFEPGMGYWLRTNTAGDITFTCGAAKDTPEKEARVAPSTLASFGMLVISERAGRERKLYFGGTLSDDVNRWQFSLPPVPPGRAFDARFADGFSLIEATSIGQEDAMDITFQAERYPVRIHVDRLPSSSNGVAESDGAATGSAAAWRYVLQALVGEEELASYDLSEGREFKITEDRVARLRLRRMEAAKDVPTEFSVYQNYPNPFNPSTTIRYALPEAMKVRVEIYNVMGQRVEVLLEEEQQAGYHKVVWNGQSAAGRLVASGVYFYVVQASQKRAVKKMILLK